MSNLKDETMRKMKGNNLLEEDIVFMGSVESGHQCTWAEFTQLADREYDQGFGAAHVAGDLVIAFKDGTTMTRGEYDGSEWWDVRRPFVASADSKPIVRVIGGMWIDLAEMQKDEED